MWNNQKGATMIEVFVGLAILMTAILGGSTYLTNFQNSRNQRKLQTTFRFLAIQATLEATNNYPFYPPSGLVGGIQPIYVACFNANGDKVSNTTAEKGRDFQFYLPAAAYADDQKSGACDPKSAAFEARFYWLSPFKSDINVNILNLHADRGRLNQRVYMNFKIFAK